MAKPNVTQPTTDIPAKTDNRVLAKAFHMAVGLDLIGSKTSMAASRNAELEVTALGMRVVSKTTGRVVLIPWPNIKGVELFPER